MTVAEASRELGYGINYIYRLLYEGKLDALKTKAGWDIFPDSVAARKAARKEAQP